MYQRWPEELKKILALVAAKKAYGNNEPVPPPAPQGGVSCCATSRTYQTFDGSPQSSNKG